MMTFLWVFVLALLFVVGSAGAMRYLDRQIPKGRPEEKPRKQDEDQE